jgi:hypothetical protein
LPLSEIGDRLGVSRGVVAGRISRARRHGDRRFQPLRPKPSLLRQLLSRSHRGPRLLIDLGWQDCRWPVGAAKDERHLFCGQPQTPGVHTAPSAAARSGVLRPSIYLDRLVAHRRRFDQAWALARPTAVWQAGGHEHPQRREPALARLARSQEPLSRACDIFLRVRRHEAPQNPDVVRTQRRAAAVCLRGPMDEVAWHARAKERASRWRA